MTIYRIHNLSSDELLNNIYADDPLFIHVNTVTKEILLETENIVLYCKKTLVLIDGELKIVNFDKSSLVHALNKKYKEFFPEIIITVSLSQLEEENFQYKIASGAVSMTIVDQSRLKLNIKNQSIELSTITQDLCFNQPNLCLSRFYREKFCLKPLEIELKANDYDIEMAQIIQFKRERDIILKTIK